MTSNGNIAVSHKAITTVQAYPKLDTPPLFAGASPDGSLSPIDQFFLNTDAINRLLVLQRPAISSVDPLPDQPQEGRDNDDADEPVLSTPLPPLPAEFSAIVVLGYMSAVESYFRALVRRLIHTDEHVRKLVEPMTVTYAAALHHKSDLLPEALIEDLSFASSKSISGMLREILGIKGNFPVAIEAGLEEFKKICEIRHCCVHRFGRLGAKNAVVLGMTQHANLLEQAFQPTFDDLQSIAEILRTFVKAINNFVFQSLVERINDEHCRRQGIIYSWSWIWNYEKDREYFGRYYEIFSSQVDSPPSAAEELIYEGFKNTYGAEAAPRKRAGQRREQKQTAPPIGSPTFQVRDFVVHPSHGVGLILAIEKQEVAGIELELHVIDFRRDNMTLRIPSANLSKVGVRRPSEPNVVQQALDILATGSRLAPTTEASFYQSKLDSGDLLAIAETVRDLHAESQTSVPSSARYLLYKSAAQRLADEIAIVKQQTEADVAKLIVNSLGKD